MKFESRCIISFSRIRIWKGCLQNIGHFIQTSVPPPPKKKKKKKIGKFPFSAIRYQAITWANCWPRSMMPYGVKRPQCVNLNSCFCFRFFICDRGDIRGGFERQCRSQRHIHKKNSSGGWGQCVETYTLQQHQCYHLIPAADVDIRGNPSGHSFQIPFQLEVLVNYDD